jgi:OmpA-OmpF porin, OOP family
MKKRILLLLTIALFSYTGVNAQGLESWNIGVGMNIIDDDGKPGGLFNISDGWNMLPYPSKFTIEGEFGNGLSLEAGISFNNHKKGKIINNMPSPANRNYMAFDFLAKYNLSESFGFPESFGPFLAGGFGYRTLGTTAYTNASGVDYTIPFAGNLGFNFGAGANFWVTEKVGLQVQSLAKFGSADITHSNHLQHSISLLYQVGGKGFGKKRYNRSLNPEVIKAHDHIRGILNRN